MENQYFAPHENDISEGARLDLRMKIAIRFVENFGMIAGRPDGEDSQGRAKGRLMEPKEVVDRAFAMAGYAVEKAEQLGWVKPVTLSNADYAKIAGLLSRIRSEADLGGYRNEKDEQESERKTKLAVSQLHAMLEAVRV